MQCRWQRVLLFLKGVVTLTVAVERNIKPSQGYIPRFSYGSNEQTRLYSFQYEVDAPQHGTWHDRQEHSSGRQTRGQFRVALPDNRLQTVTYQATDGRGFQADVHFEQHPDFPSLRGNIGKAPMIGQSVVPIVKASVPSSGIMYPTGSKHRVPQFEYKLSVGNEHRKGYISSSKAAVAVQDNYRMPRRRPVQKNTNPHNLSPKASFISHGSAPSKPLFKPMAVERPKTNHFTIPRPTFVPSRHSIRPVNSKSLTSKQRGRLTDQTNRPKVIQGNTVGSRPSRVKSSKVQSTFSDAALLTEGIPVPHVPNNPPKETIEPPATTDESFNLANKERGRYKIRRENMESIRSRLNGIVHS
ncbi:Insect cuticle protein [Trinorchestia longiramus]|nr:Insect cuticle protein [Trinorchestia longiramus]